MSEDKIPFIAREDDAALLWAFLMALQPEDLRRGDREGTRAGELRALACRRCGAEESWKVDWCLQQYGYLDWPLRRLDEEFAARGGAARFGGYLSAIVCCGSCHTGMGRTPWEEIEEQRARYDGLYICKRCEATARSIAEAPFGGCTVSGGRKGLVAESGVYHDEGMQPPGTQWLGFGGRWYLLFMTEEHESPWGGKMWDQEQNAWVPSKVRDTHVRLTNNLFEDCSLHEKLLPRFQKKVNTRIVPIELSQLRELREILDSRDWFQREEKEHG